MHEPRIEVGRRSYPLGPERAFALMLYLASPSVQRAERVALEHLLWPQEPSDRARAHSLRQLVYRLRRDGVPLQVSGRTIGLDPSGVWHDVSVFDDQLVPGLALREIPRLGSVWMERLAPTWSVPYREWLDGARASVSQRAVRSLTQQLQLARRAADWARAEALGTAILGHDPLNEEATLAIAESLAATGSKNRALELLDAYAADVECRSEHLTIAPGLLRKRIALVPIAPGNVQAASPVRGRDVELDSIAQGVMAVRRRRGAAVLVYGEPGCGKSRLLLEAERLARTEGFAIARHDGDRASRLRPFAACSALATHLLEAPGSLGASPESLAVLREVIDGGDTLDPVRVAQAVIDAAQAVSAEQPLAVIVDDLFRADSASRLAIGAIAQTALPDRVLWVIASRARTDLPDDGFASGHHHVLDRLSGASARQLVHDQVERLGLSLSSEEIETIDTVSGGNPFFLRELLAHLAARPDRSIEADSLTDVLAARIRALPAEAVSLLQLIACLDRFATIDLVQRATGLATQQLVSIIRDLELKGFLAGTGLAPRLAHALFAEAALQLLPARARQALHCLVAGELQRSRPHDEDPDVLVECARHHLEGSDTASAVALLHRAATVLTSSGRVAYLANLLPSAVLSTMPGEAAPGLLRLLFSGVASTGAITDGLSAIRRASLRGLADPSAVAMSDLFGPGSLEVHRQTDAALGEALAAARAGMRRETLPPAERLEFCAMLTVLADDVVDMEGMADAYRTSVTIPTETPEALEPSLRVGVVYQTRMGDLEVARHDVGTLLALATTGADPGVAIRAHRFAAKVQVATGSIEAARATLERAYDLAMTSTIVSKALTLTTELADLAFHAGTPDACFRWLAAGERLLSENRDPKNVRVHELLSHAATIAVRPDQRHALPIERGGLILASHPTRFRLYRMAVHCALKVARRVRISDQVLQTFRRDLLRMCPFGECDYPAAVAIRSLRFMGLADDASAVAKTVLSVRREQSPLHQSLRDAVLEHVRDS